MYSLGKMRSIITISTIFTLLCLIAVNSSAQKSNFINSSKKYKNKYLDKLNDNEKIKKSWYHYITTETDNKEYFARVFYPETKQIISYEQYESKKFKVKSGVSKKWTDEGILKSEGFYKNNERIGLWKFYNRKDGHLYEEGAFKRDVKIGIWNKYNEDGDTTAQYTYEEGVKHGAFIVYDTLGQIYNQGVYNNDSIFTQTKLDTISIDVIAELPTFKDSRCEDSAPYQERKMCSDNYMLQYIYKNLKYPAKARKLGIQGKVIAQFVVSKDGKLNDIDILSGICDELKNECIRVIKSMPTWITNFVQIEVKVKIILPMCNKHFIDFTIAFIYPNHR